MQRVGPVHTIDHHPVGQDVARGGAHRRRRGEGRDDLVVAGGVQADQLARCTAHPVEQPVERIIAPAAVILHARRGTDVGRGDAVHASAFREAKSLQLRIRLRHTVERAIAGKGHRPGREDHFVVLDLAIEIQTIKRVRCDGAGGRPADTCMGKAAADIRRDRNVQGDLVVEHPICIARAPITVVDRDVF